MSSFATSGHLQYRGMTTMIFENGEMIISSDLAPFRALHWRKPILGCGDIPVSHTQITLGLTTHGAVRKGQRHQEHFVPVPFTCTLLIAKCNTKYQHYEYLSNVEPCPVTSRISGSSPLATKHI